jgi:hypothetical protein
MTEAIYGRNQIDLVVCSRQVGLTSEKCETIESRSEILMILQIANVNVQFVWIQCIDVVGIPIPVPRAEIIQALLALKGDLATYRPPWPDPVCS